MLYELLNILIQVQKLESKLNFEAFHFLFFFFFYFYCCIFKKIDTWMLDFLFSGFDSADVACCATGYVEMGYMCDQDNPFTCADADKYVFWDAFHPTERTNGLVATHLMKKWSTKFL